MSDGELGVCGCTNRFCLEVELGVIGINVELELVVKESKWDYVVDEEQGTKYRALGDTVGD